MKGASLSATPPQSDGGASAERLARWVLRNQGPARTLLFGISPSGRDKMDRPRDVHALADDDGRYRLLVDSITDYAIYMLDADGVVASWNAGARRFKGYEASEIIGQHFSRFYTEEDRAAGLPEHTLKTAATEGRYETEGWRVRKDGTRFWANVVVDPIRDPSGDLLGYAKITRDLTERKLAADTLHRSEEQ